ncbi:MAG: TerB family tellurite resistance protein [Alphaproteobacteria bacterium]
MNVIEKLRHDTARYWDKSFLKAAMAVCALASNADDDVSLSERYRIDAVLGAVERLQVHDPHQAIGIMNEFLEHLRDDPDGWDDVLRGRISRYADDYKAARTLLRIAYLIISADGTISAGEKHEFDSICASLSVEKDRIWGEFDAATAA